MVARVKTWTTSETLASSDLNTEFNNIVNAISSSTADHIDLADVYAWTGAHSWSAAATHTNTVTVGVDDAGHDVKFFGATSGQYMLWDESADELVLTGDTKLSFHDAAGGENIIATSNGHLEVNAGTTLDITAPTVDLNSSTEFNIDTAAYDLNASGAVTIDSAGVSIDSSAASNLTTSGGALTITSAAAATWSTAAGALTVNGTGGVNIQEGGATIIAISDSRALSTSNTASVDLDATGAIAVNSSGGAISVANDNADQTVNLATAGTRTLNIGINDGTDVTTLAVKGNSTVTGTITVGVDDTGYDVKLFGATSGAYILWDESADKLLTAGGAVVDIVKDKLLIGGTAVTTTAAELNVLDAVTAGTVTASKAVVVDGSKDIGTFGTVTAGTLAGTLSTAAQANITSLGTLTALAVNGDIDMVAYGNRIDLDTDNDTSIRASADDTIMLEAGGVDALKLEAVAGSDTKLTLAHDTTTGVVWIGGDATGITLADDATTTFDSSQIGLLLIYVNSGATVGAGGIWGFTYRGTTTLIHDDGNCAASDSDGKLCVYKSADSHTTTIKNRLGHSAVLSLTRYTS